MCAYLMMPKLNRRMNEIGQQNQMCRTHILPTSNKKRNINKDNTFLSSFYSVSLSLPGLSSQSRSFSVFLFHLAQVIEQCDKLSESSFNVLKYCMWHNMPKTMKNNEKKNWNEKMKSTIAILDTNVMKIKSKNQ